MKQLLLFFFFIPCIVDAQVYTPKCSYVTGYTISEFTPSEIAYVNYVATSNYPNATMLANASATYNCHNYAWNQSDGGSTYWIDSPGDDTYWTDGSYVEVTDNALPYATKVSYPSGDHSAITTSNSNVFISKWGNWPLMQHAPTYCPYTSTGLKYYSIPISGARFICSGSENYTTISSWGISSYTWTAGSGLSPSSQTSSSNSFTATTPYNGVTSLSVSMSPTCAGTTVGATKAINMGNGPILSTVTYNGGNFPDPVCQYTGGFMQVYLHPTYPAGAYYSLSWSFSNCSSNGTNGVLFNGSIGTYAMVRVDATGVCGPGENYTKYMYIEDCGIPPQDWRVAQTPSDTTKRREDVIITEPKVYPNPAVGTVRVELPFTPGENTVLEIYDNALVRRKVIKLKSTVTSVSIADMPAGALYFRVINGKESLKKIVIKQ
ncbi:MAG: hypothetical protein QM731_17710 [Chitinophagaceae bacterium]